MVATAVRYADRDFAAASGGHQRSLDGRSLDVQRFGCVDQGASDVTQPSAYLVGPTQDRGVEGAHLIFTFLTSPSWQTTMNSSVKALGATTW
jgi:hypothetical protein